MTEITMKPPNVREEELFDEKVGTFVSIGWFLILAFGFYDMISKYPESGIILFFFACFWLIPPFIIYFASKSKSNARYNI